MTSRKWPSGLVMSPVKKMRMPRSITSPQLQSALARAGYVVTLRQLRLWRTQALLPPLRSLGRKGYRLGKAQVWRSPDLLAQAIVVCKLRALKYPNDEIRLALWGLGFPVRPTKVRSAWRSRLGKTDAVLKSKQKAAVKRRGEPFSHTEDEISTLVQVDVAKIAKHFGLKRDLLTQLSIDLFGLVFRTNYSPDDSLPSFLWDLLATFTPLSIGEHERVISNNDYHQMLRLMNNTITFDAVQKIVASATNSEFRHAHRRWRMILRGAQRMLPEFIGDEGGEMIAAKFGRFGVAGILRIAHLGKLRSLDCSLREIELFVSECDVRGMFKAMISRQRIDIEARTALRALLLKLADVWQFTGFPFSASN